MIEASGCGHCREVPIGDFVDGYETVMMAYRSPVWDDKISTHDI